MKNKPIGSITEILSMASSSIVFRSMVRLEYSVVKYGKKFAQYSTILSTYYTGPSSAIYMTLHTANT